MFTRDLVHSRLLYRRAIALRGRRGDATRFCLTQTRYHSIIVIIINVVAAGLLFCEQSRSAGPTTDGCSAHRITQLLIFTRRESTTQSSLLCSHASNIIRPANARAYVRAYTLVEQREKRDKIRLVRYSAHGALGGPHADHGRSGVQVYKRERKFLPRRTGLIKTSVFAGHEV